MVIAIVEGNNNYHVEMEIKDENIKNIYCDCPYFIDHDECKHVAAVLYNLSDTKDISINIEDDTLSIINKVSDIELRLFLCELMNNNEEVYDEFRRKFISLFPKYSSKTYKQKN